MKKSPQAIAFLYIMIYVAETRQVVYLYLGQETFAIEKQNHVP